MRTFTVVRDDFHYTKCLAIRKKVFIEEQNVPVAIEVDDMEFKAVHFLVEEDHMPVSTARYLVKDGWAKVGRVAVLKEYRGQKIGSFIMVNIIEYAQSQGLEGLKLSSQEHAKGFYEKLGFVAYGEIFMEADIPHIWMKYDF